MTAFAIAKQFRTANRVRVAQFLYTKGKSPWSDAEFDAMVAELRVMDKKFFAGVVGSKAAEVELVSKVKLPVPVGSLDKVRPSEIRKWAKSLPEKFRKSGFFVTPKLDGMSLMLVYAADGNLEAIITRGDGVTGRDVTATLKGNPTIPGYIFPRGGCKLYVRGEFILSKMNFATLRAASMLHAKEKKSREYVNARNMLVGCVGAKESNLVRRETLKLAEFIALDMTFDPPKSLADIPDVPMGASSIRADKAPLSVRIKVLEKMGFTIPHFNITTMESSKAWKGRARQNIKNLVDSHPYEVDGMVISTNAEEPEKLGYDSNGLNPKWSRAIKLDAVDQDAHTLEVGQVMWNATPRGLWKPVVRLKYPATFRGVQVRNVYVDNAKYVKENNVAEGALVTVVRSGDVIPRIVRVEMKSGEKAKLPKRCKKHDAPLEWTDTGVDLYCPICAGKPNSPADFFAQLDTDNVGKTLVANACKQLRVTTVGELMRKSKKLKGQPGWGDVSLKKFRNALRKALSEASMAKLMHASGVFRSVKLGLGETRLQAILDEIGVDKLFKYFGPATLDEKGYGDPEIRALSQKAQRAEGVGRLAADCFAMQLKNFFAEWAMLGTYCERAIKETEGRKSVGILKGKRYAFTGFRDKSIENFIRDSGGVVTGSINDKLTTLFAPDAKGMSVKLKKARELGVEIISKEHAWTHLSTTDIRDKAKQERKADSKKKSKKSKSKLKLVSIS